MLQTVIPTLCGGFLKTLEIFAVTLLGALPLGLIIAFGSMSRFIPLKALIRTIVWIVRGTPLMLQLLIIYYGPGILFDNNIWGGGANGRLTAALAAFIINYACGGIESISKGQIEAGQVLGMTRSQIFFKIVLLQVIKRIVPPMSNEIITLVKDTSLARIIAVYELIWAGQTFIKGAAIIWPLFMTGIFYLAFSGILTLLFGYIEKKLSYFSA